MGIISGLYEMDSKVSKVENSDIKVASISPGSNIASIPGRNVRTNVRRTTGGPPPMDFTTFLEQIDCPPGCYRSMSNVDLIKGITISVLSGASIYIILIILYIMFSNLLQDWAC